MGSGKDLHVSGLKVFALAVGDQQNHKDSRIFKAWKERGTKTVLCCVSPCQACLIKQLKFSYLHFSLVKIVKYLLLYVNSNNKSTFILTRKDWNI